MLIKNVLRSHSSPQLQLNESVFCSLVDCKLFTKHFFLLVYDSFPNLPDFNTENDDS